MAGQTWTWVGFILFVLALLAIDLGVFHRKPHEVTIREALAWSGVWIILALLFNLGVYYRSEEHTSELQSLRHLVCRLLLEKKKTNKISYYSHTSKIWYIQHHLLSIV